MALNFCGSHFCGAFFSRSAKISTRGRNSSKNSLCKNLFHSRNSIQSLPFTCNVKSCWCPCIYLNRLFRFETKQNKNKTFRKKYDKLQLVNCKYLTVTKFKKRILWRYSRHSIELHVTRYVAGGIVRCAQSFGRGAANGEENAFLAKLSWSRAHKQFRQLRRLSACCSPGIQLFVFKQREYYNKSKKKTTSRKTQKLIPSRENTFFPNRKH